MFLVNSLGSLLSDANLEREKYQKEGEKKRENWESNGGLLIFVFFKTWESMKALSEFGVVKVNLEQ